jgi:hypothetical protein
VHVLVGAVEGQRRRVEPARGGPERRGRRGVAAARGERRRADQRRRRRRLHVPPQRLSSQRRQHPSRHPGGHAGHAAAVSEVAAIAGLAHARPLLHKQRRRRGACSCDAAALCGALGTHVG